MGTSKKAVVSCSLGHTTLDKYLAYANARQVRLTVVLELALEEWMEHEGTVVIEQAASQPLAKTRTNLDNASQEGSTDDGTAKKQGRVRGNSTSTLGENYD